MLRPNDHVLEYVDSYLHDVLTPADDAVIEQHFERCRICAVALEEAQKRLGAVSNVPASEASNGLIETTLKRIEALDKKHGRRRLLLRRGGLGVLAASVLILGIVHLYYLNLSPSPYDLTLFGQAELHAGTSASLRVRVLDHTRARAVEGVPVAIDLIDKQGAVVHLASFTTDAEGTGKPRFRLPDWDDGAYDLRVTARPGGSTQTITRAIKLKRSWKLMLSTDRPVYQPGQEIHMRALALRRINLQPVAGQKAVFTISDPKENVIFKQNEVTSKFGICAADCPLASEIVEGTYTIRCQLGDTASQQAVEVKKYVLPKFKIVLTPDRPFYQPGQPVRGKVHAEYFFGKPVTGGSVELVFAEHKVKVRTDDKGEASFAFPPLPDSVIDKNKASEARLELQATVTDSAGQKQVRKQPLIVALEPLRIEVIPEAGTLVQGLANVIYVMVSTPDGRPARASLAIWGLEKNVATSDLGVASFDYTPWTAEVYWTIRATDDKGHTSRRDVHLTCGVEGQDFLLRTDKAVYQGGDTIRLTARGGGNKPIFIDLLKDGQTMLTDVVAMDNGRGDLRVDLPPEASGAVQLSAYRFNHDGVPVPRTRVLYIRPASGLDIKAILDKKEYRPGEQARIRFSLTDKEGNWAPGALSLAAVDEAVFSVLDNAPGREREFFVDEDKALQAIRAFYPWSPDGLLPGAAKERMQFERALFARTAVAEAKSSREPLIEELLPFVENNRNVFDVLDDPDFENLVASMNISQAALAVLRNRTDAHSLNASSFPDNVRETEAKRTHWLNLLSGLWLALIVLLLIFLAIKAARWMLETGAGQLSLAIVGCILLCVCLIPMFSVQKVRDASNQTMQLNNLRQLELALLNFKATHKKFPPSAIDLTHENANKSMDPPRVRDWFPETLLWRPELITDNQGRASLDLDLADSITTWRLTSSAVTADGRLGAAQSAIKVFQPFFVDVNLPVALTRGDEVAVPVVVYNYLDKAQEVELKITDAPWFERLDEPVRRLELGPRAVRSTFYRLRVRKVGNHDMQVTATASGVADAVKRRIEVVPDGRRVEAVWNGVLRQPAIINLDLPAGAIEGSPRLFVKFYPSTFSQLVEGLDAIFQLPYGCFEQTSSTTYPNVLALDYLRRIKKSVPAVEAKAKNYIHLGYQRLLGFEVAGGGFDWFGRPPANRTLTAYGLMEFQDMARVHDVDPKLIERTRKWLLDQRQGDGSWAAEGHMMHEPPAKQEGADLARLSTTAYIAWAVFRHQAEGAQQTRSFLRAHRPERLSDPHVLALVCNALLAIDPQGRDAFPYIERLKALKKTTPDGKLAWWQQERQTTFYGSGRAGSIETTALAALAFIRAGRDPASTRAALSWLVLQKDAYGAWPSTQATVLALQALLAGSERPLGNGERRLELTLNNGQKQTLTIPADQAEVMKLIDLSRELKLGANTLTLADNSGTAAGYQVVFRYHEQGAKHDAEGPLSIQVRFKSDKLQVGDTLQATARIANNQKDAAPMVLVELPLPGGFTADIASFDRLVADGIIARYQVQPRNILVYLRDLGAQKALELPYALHAQMPVQVRVPPARVYEYYNPDRQGLGRTTHLVVVQSP